MNPPESLKRITHGCAGIAINAPGGWRKWESSSRAFSRATDNGDADALYAEQTELPLAERIAVLRHIQKTAIRAICVMEDELLEAKQILAATNRTLNTLVAERGKAEAAARERPGTSPGTSPSFCAGIKAT